jgi:hypothetical protein
LPILKKIRKSGKVKKINFKRLTDCIGTPPRQAGYSSILLPTWQQWSGADSGPAK